MAPYHMSLGEHQPARISDMSQDTSANDLLSDDDDFDDLPSLSSISLPEILPADNSLPQLLAQSCGTEDFTNFTSVQLKVIASQTSLQRLYIYLPHLVELDLTGSHLQSLRTLGFGLDSLEVLRVGRCALTTLDGLFGVGSLRELHAPNNSITDLGLLPTLPSIRIVDLRKNLVSNLMQVGFLSVCDALRELTLAECPVCQLPGYRAAVISTLPKLTSLDGFLLAEGGPDECGDGRSQSPDRSDGEDGATALPVEVNKPNGSPAGEMDVPRELKSRRPATVSGHRAERQPLVLPTRPVTAAPRRHTTHLTDPEHSMGDSVSKLTSGGVVCGNLALALRGKHRQHKPAWSVPQEQEAQSESLTKRNGLNVSQLYGDLGKLDTLNKIEKLETLNKIEKLEKIEPLEAQRHGAGDSISSSKSKRSAGLATVLEASRQWRESYYSYRTAHREQWKKEEEEEEGA